MRYNIANRVQYTMVRYYNCHFLLSTDHFFNVPFAIDISLVPVVIVAGCHYVCLNLCTALYKLNFASSTAI
jgi:hypothetical protein